MDTKEMRESAEQLRDMQGEKFKQAVRDVDVFDTLRRSGFHVNELTKREANSEYRKFGLGG